MTVALAQPARKHRRTKPATKHTTYCYIATVLLGAPAEDYSQCHLLPTYLCTYLIPTTELLLLLLLRIQPIKAVAAAVAMHASLPFPILVRGIIKRKE